MKLADLPPSVIEDLSIEQKWRLDIDPGLDAKHEFWMSWRHFLIPFESIVPNSEEDAEEGAEFLNFEGFDVLLPVPRSHHPHIKLIRLMPSKDEKTLTLFLHDSYHREWFNDLESARYGFLAVADRYQQFDCDFYLASYYHFSYLINEDYQAALKIMEEKLKKL